MARFTTDRPRFIGGSLRKAGSEFSLNKEDVPKKLPEGMKALNVMTPAQKAAETKRLKKEEDERLKADGELSAAGVGNTPDFMEGEVETK